jgi:hypothetical protein
VMPLLLLGESVRTHARCILRVLHAVHILEYPGIRTPYPTDIRYTDIYAPCIARGQGGKTQAGRDRGERPWFVYGTSRSTLCAGTGAQPRRGATAQPGQAQVYTGPAVRVARLLRPRVALGERATIWFPNARMNSSQTNKRFA